MRFGMVLPRIRRRVPLSKEIHPNILSVDDTIPRVLRLSPNPSARRLFHDERNMDSILARRRLEVQIRGCAPDSFSATFKQRE